MILGLILFVLMVAVAFFHYIQGMMASAISAVCAMTAAMIAMGYTESVVASVAKGKYIDNANAIVLCSLFALIYIVLRVGVDMAVPGNIRIPVLMDKIGGGAIGLIVGLLATGVIAVAAQSLPLGPSIGGYSRYSLKGDQSVTYASGSSRQEDGMLLDMVDKDDIDGSSSGLLIPVDDLLIGLTRMVSGDPDAGTGSLSGSMSFGAAHPDLLQEYFGNRIGIQVGAKRTAMNIGDTIHVRNDVKLFTQDSFAQKDGEQSSLHPGRSISPTLKPDSDEVLIVARVVFTHDASDDDNLFRVSPGAVRLVAGGRNYFPIGTLNPDLTMIAHRIDDPLFINVASKDTGADFVFKVKFEKSTNADKKNLSLAKDAFIEVKRYGRVDLAGKKVESNLTANNDIRVVRPKFLETKAETPKADAGTPKPVPAGMFNYRSVSATAKLPDKIQISIAATDDNGSGVQLKSGSTDLKSGKLDNLIVNSNATVKQLSEAGEKIMTEVYVPDGMQLIQVQGAPGSSNNGWDWAQRISDFSLLDTAGKSYKAVGGFAKSTRLGSDFLFARYASEGPIPAYDKQDGKPTNIWILFLVPQGTKAKELQLSGATVSPVTMK